MERPLARAEPEQDTEEQPKKQNISFIKMLLEALVLTLFILTIYFLSPYELVSTSTDSMAPELPIGSFSFAIQTNAETEYQVGDIITFSADYGGIHYSRITHRIVAIDGETITTKGDHNPANDPFTITREQIRNKVKWPNIFNKE